MLDRRRFLKILGWVGLGVAATAKPTLASADAQPINYYPSLVAAIKEQNNRMQCGTSAAELENLSYAYEKIRPGSHVERALLVAIGSAFEPRMDIVDEYVRRRSGQPSRLDDHILFALQGYSMPETCRIPLFREQLVKLILEMAFSSNYKAEEYLSRRYMQGHADTSSLREIAKQKYRETLTGEEFNTIERMLRYYSVRSRQYAWCSTIVNRAEELAIANNS